MEYRKLEELKKLADNPRKISENNFRILCTSIRRYPKLFEARPLILSNRTGELVIIGGNQRFEACERIGLKEAPTYLMENLTEEEEKEITIRDNVNNGEYDWSVIAEKKWNILPLEEWGLKIKEIKESFGTVKKDIEFTEELKEEHNYIVLYFNNEIDWLNMLSIYPLENKRAFGSKKGFEKIGVGRVVKGADFINKIIEKKQ